MEVELKLALPPAAVARLLRHPALAGLKRGRLRRERLEATYFDTPQGDLAAAAMALRVRREGHRWVQALKGAGPADGGGVSARAEHEWPLGGGAVRPAPDLARLAEVALGRKAIEIAGKASLVPLFTTAVLRTTIPLAFPDSTMALASIDVGHVRTAHGLRRRAAVCELEVELEAGEPARLFELAQVLAADLPLRVEPRSKAERGHALVTSQPRSPARAEPVAFPPEAAPGQAFAAILANCARHIERNADGALRDDDAEWVHQMRIGVRRMRSALVLARPLAAPEVLAPLVEELKWLAGVLAPARDLDVFIAETLPALREAGSAALDDIAPLEAALSPLAASAEARRRQARRAARAAIGSSRFQRLLLAAGALATAAPRWHPAQGEDGPAVAAGGQDFASAALRRLRRRMRKAGDGIAKRTPAERHAFRIAAKKLRYATEFFAPWFPDKRARDYRKTLTALQEVLGRMNDAAVATGLAAGLAGPSTPVQALFTGWTLALTQAGRAPLAQACRRLRAEKPFWNG